MLSVVEHPHVAGAGHACRHTRGMPVSCHTLLCATSMTGPDVYARVTAGCQEAMSCATSNQPLAPQPLTCRHQLLSAWLLRHSCWYVSSVLPVGGGGEGGSGGRGGGGEVVKSVGTTLNERGGAIANCGTTNQTTPVKHIMVVARCTLLASHRQTTESCGNLIAALQSS